MAVFFSCWNQEVQQYVLWDNLTLRCFWINATEHDLKNQKSSVSNSYWNFANLSIMSTKLSGCNFLSIRRSYVFYKSLHTACSDIFLIKHVHTHTHTHTHTHKTIYTKRKAYLFFISNNWLLSTGLFSSSWKKKHTHTHKSSVYNKPSDRLISHPAGHIPTLQWS